MVNTFIVAGIIDGYFDHVRDIVIHPDFIQLDDYTQHLGTSRLEHSFHVSVIAWKLAQVLGLDERLAARAGLLHDFCLYDFHNDATQKKCQLVVHPFCAVEQSKKCFLLTRKEEKAIISHMFPLGPIPTTGEAWLITLADKICAIGEFITGFNTVLHKRLFVRYIQRCR